MLLHVCCSLASLSISAVLAAAAAPTPKPATRTAKHKQSPQQKVKRRWQDTLVTEVEKRLFAVGAGDEERTRMLLAELLERRAVQRLLPEEWQA